MVRLTRAAGIAAAIVFAATGTLSATPSFAWQVDLPAAAPAVLTTPPVTLTEVPPAPPAPAAQAHAPDGAQPPQAPAHKALAALVADRAAAEPSDDEQGCLATAVYFEAKSEPLKGQLGVAHVILNRTHSGRFPRSVCGVVKQPGQFSFVHGGRLPRIPHASGQWKTAVAIAGIALAGNEPAPAPRALFFHARSVSPGWHGLTRVAAIGNHVFYR